MWLIMFRPNGTNNFVPQGLCYSEQEARNWVQNAPYTVVGDYTYQYVPLISNGNYWQRQKPYQFPGYNWPNSIPYYVNPPLKQWRYEVGDWPKITCE